MFGVNGSLLPCVIFGHCNREGYLYRGICETCSVLLVYQELQRGAEMPATWRTLDDFPCPIWSVDGCSEEVKEGHERVCENCKMRELYLDYLSSRRSDKDA